MMIDYNVRDDWPAGEPLWMKSLVSSLDRRHGPTSVLPLSVTVQEVLDWVQLASGSEAWAKPQNRLSLFADFRQSVDQIGPDLAALLLTQVADFVSALTALDTSKKDAAGGPVLAQPPGTRADPVWTEATRTGQLLLDDLASDLAVSACWDDLAAVARDATLIHREYRPIADNLFEQLRLRRLEPGDVFSTVKRMLAYGHGPNDDPWAQTELSADERLAAARALMLGPAVEESIVVWLGYVGAGGNQIVEAGNFTFYWAQWAVANTEPDRQDFLHKAELTNIVGHGQFKVRELVDEKSDVDLLVRVDLGVTTAAGAADRAENLVLAILNMTIHKSNGMRPTLVESIVLQDGTIGLVQFQAPDLAFDFEDDYGMNITADAIAHVAPGMGAALTASRLPVYLTAALDAQTVADLPYRRERMSARAHDSELRGSIPLEDRVVQHVAAYAALKPGELFELLARRWPGSRWQSDVMRAVRMCILGAGPEQERVLNLQRKFYSTSAKSPWLVFAAEHEADLVDVCRVESEKTWVARMLRSVSDPALYEELLVEYETLSEVQIARRARARNALVHGNPIQSSVVESVGSFSSYMSQYALQLGLESFESGTDVMSLLDRDLDEVNQLRGGIAAADYWRAKAAAL